MLWSDATSYLNEVEIHCCLTSPSIRTYLPSRVMSCGIEEGPDGTEWNLTSWISFLFCSEPEGLEDMRGGGDLRMAGGFKGLIGLKGFPSPKDEHFHHELMEAQPGIREGLMADEGLEIRLSDLLSPIYHEWGNRGRPLYSIFTIKHKGSTSYSCDWRSDWNDYSPSIRREKAIAGLVSRRKLPGVGSAFPSLLSNRLWNYLIYRHWLDTHVLSFLTGEPAGELLLVPINSYKPTLPLTKLPRNRFVTGLLLTRIEIHYWIFPTEPALTWRLAHYSYSIAPAEPARNLVSYLRLAPLELRCLGRL